MLAGLRGQLVRAQLGRRQRPGQVGVHLRGGHAEPVRLAGEVAADLVGVQVGLGVQVADADLGQLPAVGGGAEELLQHRQVDPVVARRPASSVQWPETCPSSRATCRAPPSSRDSASCTSMSGLRPG